MVLILITLFHSWSVSYAQIGADFAGAGGGAVRFGESVSTCNAGAQGAIRYESVGMAMQYCNGTSWKTFFAETCAPTSGSNWTFTHLANQATSTTVTSSIHQVTGITGCTVSIKVSGDGSPEYRICSDSTCSTVDQTWGSTESDLTNNKYVQLRLTTAATGNVLRKAVLTMGSFQRGWLVRTQGNCADADPGVGTICADGSVFIGFTPDTGAKTYATDCHAGRTLSGGACTGTANTYVWSTTATINTGVTKNLTGETNTTNLVGLSNADTPYTAAAYCDGLNQHSKTDWYLPAYSEISLIHSGCEVLPDTGCSNTTRLWTSTEVSATNAWYYSAAGGPTSTGKINVQRIRCFRKD